MYLQITFFFVGIGIIGNIVYMALMEGLHAIGAQEAYVCQSCDLPNLVFTCWRHAQRKQARCVYQMVTKAYAAHA